MGKGNLKEEDFLNNQVSTRDLEFVKPRNLNIPNGLVGVLIAMREFSKQEVSKALVDKDKENDAFKKFISEKVLPNFGQRLHPSFFEEIVEELKKHLKLNN